MAVERLRGTASPQGSRPAFLGQQIMALFARVWILLRIGATFTDQVRRGGIGHGSSWKRLDRERRRSCHARESHLPLAEGDIESF